MSTNLVPLHKMKKYILYLLLTIVYTMQANAQKAPVTPGNFNKNWEFVKDIDTTNAVKMLSKTAPGNVAWQKITLPHTANIEPVQKVKEQWQGTCYYRKFFIMPVADKGKHVAIQIDAAMHDADVYLNGTHIFKHVGGYLPLYIDITKTAKYGQQNCVLIKLNNQDNPVIPPGKPIKDLDFNYYGGIYRNSWFIVKNKLHISDAVQANRLAGGGVLIADEEVSAKTAKLVIKTDVDNDLDQAKKAVVKVTLMDANGKVVATAEPAEQLIKAGGHGSFGQSIRVIDPKLWSPDHPNLYSLKVQILQNGQEADVQTIKTGIRSIKFTANGLYLNGEKLNIYGTNRHQEYPYIGYALSDNAQYRDAYKIKSAGFNFVRCSHYPPSPAYLDACDELGIMVMDAIPGWQFFGNAEFQKNSFQDIRDMIHRDRNHASIVLWEASLNETGMSRAFMDTANKIVHTELPFNNTFSSGWKDYAYDVFIPARQHLKAPDYWKKYNKDKPLLIGEYGDWEYYAQNAGFNQADYQNLKTEEKTSRQTRGDGQKRMLQQALNFHEAHNDNYYGRIVGDLNWLMFDYKRGYAADLETSGIMDIFRLPKFSYYFYQSQKDVAKSRPILFIANYWNDPAQKTVRIYSNCDAVELFLNGKSLGMQKPDTGQYNKNLAHPPFTFHPEAYAAGTLSAVGYINGKKTIMEKVSTPGKSAKIQLSANLSGKKLVSGKNDVAFVYARITDANGTVMPVAENKISFSVKGPGTIIGPTLIKAEAGIATILLKAGDKAGHITVIAKAEGLPVVSYSLEIK
jgi:beta-galactosidase